MTSEKPEADRALIALVALAAADRSERDPEPRVLTEVLLHDAGYSNQEIGAMLGEKPDTIRKRIARAGDSAPQTRKGSGR
jgi:DNA-directed RNA polymerase specialized sigma24 family protein